MRASMLPGRFCGVIPALAAMAAAACVWACVSESASEPVAPRRADQPELGQVMPDEAGALDLGGSALVVQSAGMEELFSDPRDAGLRRVLALLDERLLELPDELGGDAPPPGTVEFLCDALSSPWTLRVDLDGPAPIPIRVTWLFRAGSAERASALAQRFAGLVALLGMPTSSAENRRELTEVEMPGGSLFHGTTEDGTAFLIAWGEPREGAPDLGASGLPRGVRPGLVLGIDLGAILGTIERMLPADADAAGMLRRQLELVGLHGAPPVQVTFATGHGSDRAHIVSRYMNWVPMAEKTGALAAGPLPRAALELVPDDATFVSLSRGEPKMLERYLALAEAENPEVLAELKEALGIELVADLLEPLGQTFGFYLSDSTGGGDLTSAVLFLAVDDEARLTKSLDALAARLNELATAEAEGRLRLQPFEHGSARGFELDFPGLPVPLSPTLALASGHLFVAASPQALAAALDHARGRQRGADGAPSWRRHLSAAQVASLGGSLDDLQGLLFLDAPRLARSGYGLASLIAAAFANGVRSPADAGRDPGLVMPSFAALLAGAQPTVMLSRVHGQDLVMVGSSDRSAMVHVAATLGWAPSLMSGIVLMGAVASVVALPNALEKLDDAQTLTAQADIVSLREALDGYALENDGRYPASLATLLEPDEDGLTWINAEEIPADPWGNPYVYEIDAEGVRVLSYGADGVPGGEGEARDIDSDELWSEESWDDFETGEGMEFELEEGEGGEESEEDEGAAPRHP